MFSLLVSGVAGAWEGSYLDMDLDRFNTYSGKCGEIIDPDDPASLRQLDGAVALVLYELGVEGPNAKVVRHGRLRNVAKYGQVVSCQIELDPERPYLPREKIVDFQRHLDMHRLEQGRTHWAIKDGDLPPALLEAGTPEPPADPGAPPETEVPAETLVGGIAVLPERQRRLSPPPTPSLSAKWGTLTRPRQPQRRLRPSHPCPITLAMQAPVPNSSPGGSPGRSRA